MGDHTQTRSFPTSLFLSLSSALPSTHTLHYLLIIKITAIAVTCDDFWRADAIEKPARMSGRSRDRNRGATGAGAREMQELMQRQRLEPDKGQSAAPLARTLIASTLRLLFLWNFSCFPSFVSTSHSPPHLLSLFTQHCANHLTSTVSLMKQKFRFYIFTKNWKAPQV